MTRCSPSAGSSGRSRRERRQALAGDAGMGRYGAIAGGARGTSTGPDAASAMSRRVRQLGGGRPGPPIARRGGWLALLLQGALLAWPAAAAAAVEDPALAAADQALAGGLPAQSVLLLSKHPGLAQPGAERLTLARAYLALGRGDDALAALHAVPGRSWLDAWPDIQRGAAAQCAGEAWLQRGDDGAARAMLDDACRQSAAVAVDRCLALLADLCRKAGDLDHARDYARVLWTEWPRSPYRGHGGLLLAQLIAGSAPDEARGVLAGVRLIDTLADADRLGAAELLCRLTLERHPGDCLVVAEQEARRLAATGQLPLYRALALSALDGQEGVRALLALPLAARQDPAACAALERLQRLQQAPRERLDPELVCERARAEAELGRVDAARALLLPLAAEHPAALVALAELPGGDLTGFIAAPAARHPIAALALGRALVLAGQPEPAWTVLAGLVQRTAGPAPAGAPPAQLLYWAERAARIADPAAAATLRQRLLQIDEAGAETGLAWCDEAERRLQEGGDAEAAWERAARLLPADHPWAAAASWRAARLLLETSSRIEEARRLVEKQGWAGSAADQLRCRFLLVQILERLGDRAGALRTAESLLPLADGEQRDRLQRIIGQLRPGP